MSNSSEVVSDIIMLIVAIVGAIFAAIAAHKRRQGLRELARKLGLKFESSTNRDLARQYGFLDKLARGSDRYASNVISGSYQGQQILAFDYHYETGSGKNRTHHRFSFFILTLPKALPEVTITREGLMSKIAQSVGYDDIDFESAEFSRLFCVRARDKRFAYDVCHARMMEYLLANTDLSIEIERTALAIGFDSLLEVPKIEPNLKRLLRLRGLLPEYLVPAPVPAPQRAAPPPRPDLGQLQP